MLQNNSNKKLIKITRPTLIIASFCTIFLGLLFSSSSLKAQIENFYDEKSQEVGDISALMSATVSHDVEGVRFFSKAGAAAINQKNLGGATSLHMAARVKDLEIAKILIENGANVNAADNEGWTPIMRASLSGDSEIVSLLLDSGAQPNQLNSVGESAIIQATLSDCDGCLKVMFTKFNFIKLVDNKLLRDQISKAFIIAKNRDNQVIQNILNQYLDQAVKISLLIDGASEDIVPAIDKQPAEYGIKERVFKLINNDHSDKKMECLPVAITKDAEKNKSRTGKKYLFKGRSTNQSKTIDGNIVKKFRFISGQQQCRAIEVAKAATLPAITKLEKALTSTEAENEKVIKNVIYNFRVGKTQDIKLEKDGAIILNEKAADSSGTTNLNKSSEIEIIKKMESAADVIKKSNKGYKIIFF